MCMHAHMCERFMYVAPYCTIGHNLLEIFIMNIMRACGPKSLSHISASSEAIFIALRTITLSAHEYVLSSRF